MISLSGYRRQVSVLSHVFCLHSRRLLIMLFAAGLLFSWAAPVCAGPDSGSSRYQKKYSYPEKRKLKKKARKYQSMSPARRKELQRNMDRFHKLPPEKQQTYKKRYRQFQQLPPAEQKKIRKKLKKNRLTPKEKDEIRKKFR